MASTTTTTTAAPCIYKSVILAAGEKFTLPPGSTIIGATGGLSSVKSTCPLPDKLEDVICYFAVFQSTEEKGGAIPPYDSVRVDGIMINTVKYPFSTGGFTFDRLSGNAFYNLLNSKLKTTPVGSALLNLTVTNAKVYNGEYYRFTFNTVPSIGDTLEFYGYGGGGRQGSPGTYMSFLATKCP
jgi:hypothetical protein